MYEYMNFIHIKSLATQASLSLTHKHHNGIFCFIVSFIAEMLFVYEILLKY
jgi:hypothetical protein